MSVKDIGGEPSFQASQTRKGGITSSTQNERAILPSKRGGLCEKKNKVDAKGQHQRKIRKFFFKRKGRKRAGSQTRESILEKGVSTLDTIGGSRHSESVRAPPETAFSEDDVEGPTLSSLIKNRFPESPVSQDRQGNIKGKESCQIRQECSKGVLNVGARGGVCIHLERYSTYLDNNNSFKRFKKNTVLSFEGGGSSCGGRGRKPNQKKKPLGASYKKGNCRPGLGKLKGAPTVSFRGKEGAGKKGEGSSNRGLGDSQTHEDQRGNPKGNLTLFKKRGSAYWEKPPLSLQQAGSRKGAPDAE